MGANVGSSTSTSHVAEGQCRSARFPTQSQSPVIRWGNPGTTSYVPGLPPTPPTRSGTPPTGLPRTAIDVPEIPGRIPGSSREPRWRLQRHPSMEHGPSRDVTERVCAQDGAKFGSIT